MNRNIAAEVGQCRRQSQIPTEYWVSCIADLNLVQLEVGIVDSFEHGGRN